MNTKSGNGIIGVHVSEIFVPTQLKYFEPGIEIVSNLSNKPSIKSQIHLDVSDLVDEALLVSSILSSKYLEFFS